MRYRNTVQPSCIVLCPYICFYNVRRILLNGVVFTRSKQSHMCWNTNLDRVVYQIELQASQFTPRPPAHLLQCSIRPNQAGWPMRHIALKLFSFNLACHLFYFSIIGYQISNKSGALQRKKIWKSNFPMK